MSACRFTVFFLVLLHNHCYCYSLHKTKSRLVTWIWEGPGPVATKLQFFRRNSILLQIFSAPTQEGKLLFLSKRTDRKKLYNFPIKLNHLCRTSRHVWLSFSACDRCCAYHLICIMTISTYTTGARAHFFTVQEPSKRVICALAPVAAVNFLKGKEFYENSRQSYWILKKVKFFNCLSSIINRFKLIGFTSNWLIRLTWQLRCLQTEQKSQQSLIFSSRAYALVYRGSRACVSLAITL